MNYRRLEAFLAVVDTGTVTAAAAELRIAQPALSRQLQALERGLRLALFEPKGNRLVLTAAGRAFAVMARDLVTQTRNVEKAVRGLSGGGVGSLVVAATAASINGFLAPFIATTTAPDPLLITRAVSHFGIYDTLREGADFVVSPAPQRQDLTRHNLGGVAVKAYVAPDHPWARSGRTTVGLADLVTEPLILPSTASVSRVELDVALGRAGLALDLFHECDDGHTAQALAAAGHGVGVVTDTPRYGTVGLPVVDDTGRTLAVPLHVAWDPRHYAADAIADLARRLSDFRREQAVITPPGA